MEFLRTLARQLREVWQGMSPGRRFGLIVVTLIAVGVVLGIGYWAAQPDYRVLFSGLAVEDSAAITAKLQAQGAPYRLAGGGTTILVDADQVSQRRLELAADGLPAKGGKGFELFDQAPLGMTPFTQHVNYLRALQAELAKTIMGIDPVVSARVHIVRPDPSPFIREQKPTTASVMLRLKPGTTLSRQLGNGIAALVAHSVEGLTRENVTLVDANGKVLSEDQSQETGHIASQMEYRRELESYLASKAESMLAQVFGPGRALVRVTADINFQRHREKKETYNPDGRVAKTEKIVTTKSETKSAPPVGPAGAASNLPRTSQGATTTQAGNNNSEETIETDFAVSKTIQEFEDKMGAVERLTVAALVDLSASEKDKEAPMKIDEVKDIIKQAVGYKPNRDEITVTNVKLTPPVEADPTAEEQWHTIQRWQNIANLVRNASLAVTALVALLMVWMVLRRFKPGPAAQPAPAEEPEGVIIMKRFSATAERDPQAVAQVLETWLSQPQSSRAA